MGGDCVTESPQSPREDPVKLLFDLNIHGVVRNYGRSYFQLLDLCVGNPVLRRPLARAIDREVRVEWQFGGASEGCRIGGVL